MKNLDSLQRIRHLIGIFVQDVKSSSAMGHTDVNKVSEDVLVPLLRLIFNYSNLKNLNANEKENFPGVDLGDYEKGVAIQVTSTPSSDKIKSSLEKFVSHGLDESFNHFRFYILTEKQKTYQGSDWASIVDGRFRFVKDKDILDYTDLLKAIAHLDIEDIYRIESFLEDIFGSGKFSSFSTLTTKTEPEQREKVFSNLLETFFADTLYVAKLKSPANPKKLPSQNHEPKQGRKPGNSDFRLVREFLSQQGTEDIRDWICHDGQLLTFRDLTSLNEPLRMAVDVESIEGIAPDEYFDIGEDEERTFKFLLDRCLSVRLAPKAIEWQSEESCYVFMPYGSESARKEGNRTVYNIKYKLDGKSILHHRHLAFRTRYHRFNDKWYVSITPDWYFSYDGSRKSIHHSELVDGLKGFETNDTVFRHTRGICTVMKSDIPATIFESAVIYPFLWFGEILSFADGQFLDDVLWNPNEADKSKGLNLNIFQQQVEEGSES